MADDESRWELDWWAAIPPLCLLLGAALILMPAFLPERVLKSTAWTPEQAQQYQAASVKFHGLSQSYRSPGPESDPGTLRQELEQAKAEYEALRAQLDNALARPEKLAWILRGLGATLVVVGGYFAYVSRSPG